MEKELESNTADREISTTRIFDAPRELVWEAWTNPKHIVHWWGPNGFTNTIDSMEVKPGGIWKFIMHGPDGTDYPNQIVYSEVVKPSRLVYTHGTGEADYPGEFRVTVLFTEKNGKTELFMRSVFKTAEARNEVVEKYGATEGLNQTLTKLADYLPKM
ncbi:ATPase [Leptospira fluminis]|uniref:ATPase n=1 Tax=Leptospira fluminis TaxID=2484979 RepID=A0A4R9GSK3_9LEPT|nr:SRPBCC family protein [Leptospira fluminis]TGK20053.1 ATPase [Leptospira fluminis]